MHTQSYVTSARQIKAVCVQRLQRHSNSSSRDLPIPLFLALLLFQAKYGFDDSLDVFGVHGVGGFVGTLLLSVFATTAFGGNQAITVAALAKVQFFAAGYATVYTFVVTWLILKLTDVTLGARRASSSLANVLECPRSL